jgi:DNA-binding MarR family transcriptional regulator
MIWPMPAPTGRSRARPVPSPIAAERDAGDPAVRVLRRFRLVFNAVKKHFQQVEKKVGVGGAQVWALSVIQRQPGIGVGGLAAAMDIHQTTASNLVKALVASDMVAASKNGLDRRAVQLRLLPAGARVLRKAPGPFAGVLPDALGQLDAATLERLDRDLAALLALLHPDARASGTPLAQM